MTKIKEKYYIIIFIAMGIFMGCLRGGLYSSAGQYLVWVAQDFNVPISSVTLYYSVQAIAMIITLPLASFLLKKVKIKTLLIFTVSMQMLGYIALGYTNSLIMFYLCAAVVAIGTTVNGQLAAPLIINAWFEKSASSILGATMALSNLIGVFAQPLIGNNIHVNGWRFSYISTGLILGISALIVTIIFIKSSPYKNGYMPYKNEENKLEDEDNYGISLSESKNNKLLYVGVLFMFIVSFSSGFTMFITAYSTSLGYDAAVSGNIYGLYMAGLCIGSILFGILNDKLGVNLTVKLNILIGALSYTALIITGKSSFVILCVSMFFVGMFASSLGVIAPVVIRDVFGKKYYDKIFPVVSVGIAFGGIIASPIIGMLFDVFSNYNIALVLVLVVNLANVLVVNYMYKKRSKVNV